MTENRFFMKINKQIHCTIIRKKMTELSSQEEKKKKKNKNKKENISA